MFHKNKGEQRKTFIAPDKTFPHQSILLCERQDGMHRSKFIIEK